MDRRNVIKKRYYLITGVLFLLGLILLFLPHKKNTKELSPEKLLLSITNEDRFFTPDDVARLIISEDPSIQLIDVRKPEEYQKYSLPGALNIPLSAILDKDENGDLIWAGYFDDENKTTILYSNGSVYANQAWMLTKRLDFKHNYVMKGGLNQFFEDIILVSKPKNSAPESAHHIYQFRKGAAQFFGGGKSDAVVNSETAPVIKTPPPKKKEKVVEEGGC